MRRGPGPVVKMREPYDNVRETMNVVINVLAWIGGGGRREAA